MLKQFKPADADRGPMALARAPRALNTPNTEPFWLSAPYSDIIVVMQGTTVAEAAKSAHSLMLTRSGWTRRSIIQQHRMPETRLYIKQTSQIII